MAVGSISGLALGRTTKLLLNLLVGAASVDDSSDRDLHRQKITWAVADVEHRAMKD